MDKVKLVIERDRFIEVDNPFGEKSTDYICKNIFILKKERFMELFVSMVLEGSQLHAFYLIQHH